MSFSYDVVIRAWDRQGGKCAHCCKPLSLENRDYGEGGAWHAHHRRPISAWGSDLLENCVILCINEPNCHLNVGHGGSWDKHAIISDSQLPCLISI